MTKISRRDFMKWSAAGMVALTMPGVLMGCHNETGPAYQDRATDNLAKLSRAGLKAEEQYVRIPGCQREYHFMVVNDLHINIFNDEIREDVAEQVRQRHELEFVDSDGTKAHDLWNKIVKTANQMELDGVILAADMIDFYSEANVACLREGCQKLKVPFMLLRADHDYTDGYVQETSWDVIDQAHKTIDSHEDVMVLEYDECMIVGINNTTSQLTETALGKLEDLFAAGKPIILVSHVPFASLVDSGISDMSKEKWNGLELLWAYNGFPFVVGEYGERLMDRIFAPDTPVVEVLGGHLHFSYEGPLTETVHQRVFDASYKGTVGYVVAGPGEER